MPHNKKVKDTSALAKAVRKPSTSRDYVMRSKPHHAPGPRLKDYHNGKITLIGYYNKHLKDLQNERRWNDKTCRGYDRVMNGSFGRLFLERPMEEMDEWDYLVLWEKYLAKRPSDAQRAKAYFLIRYLVRLAFKEGVSDVYFWGTVEDEIEEHPERYKIKNKEKKARTREALGLRIARSLSLEAELKLLCVALDRMAKEGSVLAGILVFLLGLRPSEACGLRYSDMVEIRPGYWGVKRRFLLDRISGDFLEGSKTPSGYRLLPLPRFLAASILRRKEEIQSLYPGEDINSWPISCAGQDYQRPADPKLVNKVMSELYLETECDQDLMRMALQDFRTDSEIRQDCEKSLVVYLGRHQMMTEMVAIGMPERYIFALAGHAQKDPNADIADLANPDVLVEVSDYLNRRPAIWVLDHSVKNANLKFTGEKNFSVLADGEVEIEVSCGQNMILMLQEKEPMDSAEILFPEGIQIKDELSLAPMSLNVTKTISITPYLRKAAEAAASAQSVDKLHEDSSNLDFTFTAIELEPEKEELLPFDQIVVKRKPRVAKKEAKRAETAAHHVADCADLYAQDDKRDLFYVPRELLEIRTRNTKGRKPVGRDKIKSLYYYDPSQTTFVLTKEGLLCPMPPKQRLDELLKTEEGKHLATHLRNGAVLISFQDESPDQCLVCMTDNGYIVAYPADRLNRLRPAGRVIVKLEDDQRLASACFCKKEEGILLVAGSGKVLHLAREDLPVRKNLGASTITGIRIPDGDRAVSCLPYRDGDFFFAKADGMIAAVKDAIMPHSRGSFGVQAVNGSRIVAAFPRPDAVAMLDSSGYLAVFAGKDFEPHKARIKGVSAKKMRPGEILSCACGLYAVDSSPESESQG